MHVPVQSLPPVCPRGKAKPRIPPRTALRALLHDHSGSTVIEYAFIVAIIAFGAIAVLLNLSGTFMTFAHGIQTAFTNAGL